MLLYSVCLMMSLLISCANNSEQYLKPTNSPAFTPDNDTEFTSYISNSQQNIENILNTVRPNLNQTLYLAKYTNREVALMRSPFQMQLADRGKCNALDNGKKKGFLLIHGLTDSPYMMRSIGKSLINRYPCSLVRAVLLTGHGTVVGDSLNMKKQDWKRIVKYGVHSFKKENRITELYLVGFSTGTTLAIDYVQQNPADSQNRADKVKGLVLMSTAIKAKSKFASLTPFLSNFKHWLSVFFERDAARYESFSFNAAAQFYDLTQDILLANRTIKIPVLMALSADDATIDPIAAREFFCGLKEVNKKTLIWYQSIDQKYNNDIKSNPNLMCGNIIEVELDNFDPKYKTINLAHIATAISPNDAHYGLNGNYHNCKKYDSNITPTEDFKKCQSNDADFIYGENNVQALNGRYLRRGSFNPDYKNLEAKILCFVDDNCSN